MILKPFRLSTITLMLAISLYTFISKRIFDQINLTSYVIVDEEFHLPLGEAFCRYNFNEWDPKVTTFPGLYILSAVLLGQFKLCSTYWLRFISFLSSIVNIILFYMLFKVYQRQVAWKNVISAINLSLLPPLYFFSNLYYTDVASIMMTILLLICAKRESHYLASVFGALAIIMRQTNVIWIGMVFGDYIIKKLYVFTFEDKKHLKQIRIPIKGVGQLIKNILVSPLCILRRVDIQFALDCLAYISVISCFLLFVYQNGSIVVGDKSAHEATLHVTQMFYFATFTLLFGWPHFLDRIPSFFEFVCKHKCFMFITVVVCVFIIHFNTLVHPYMLADNRHYMFYIWNRFYGKYFFFPYTMSFVYIFAIYGILAKTWNEKDVSFFVMYIISTSFVLIMQRLIEFRYFLLPYIIFRMQVKRTPTVVLIMESLTYLAVNAFTLYMFFSKEISWDTYDYPQRLIW